jgi:hypothetical protein
VNKPYVWVAAIVLGVFIYLMGSRPASTTKPEIPRITAPPRPPKRNELAERCYNECAPHMVIVLFSANPYSCTCRPKDTL